MEHTSVGTLVKCITNEYEKHLSKMMSEVGLTSAQCEVLYFLYESNDEQVNQRDIEEYLNLSNPTVTGLLKRLDEKGYILIVPNSTDKRKKNVHLSERFYQLERKITMSKRKMEKDLLRGMRKSEVESLKKHLEKALRNIEG